MPRGVGPWVCALLVLAAAPASGQQLIARHYTIADGLANNTIGSVYQDRKGYLWFATAEGLSRFDGYTFSSYGLADGLPHTIAHAVAEDVSGTLWVATTGGLVRLLDTPAVSRERFVAHRVGPTPASNQLDSVVSDRAGAIWCVTGDGLYRGNGDGAGTTFTRVVDVGPRGSTALFVDRRGRVWYAPDRELFVVSPDGVSMKDTDPGTSTPISRPTQLSVRNMLDLTATLAMIAAAGSILWLTLRSPLSPSERLRVPIPQESLTIDGAPALGTDSATVVLVVFSDFECPYCARFAQDVWPELKTKWVETGRVLVVFRHLPLTSLHPRAVRAAEAAECGALQGRFWPLHDQLFNANGRLEDSDLLSYARVVDLDLVGFDACMRRPVRDRIRRDRELAKSLRLSGTPTFLIGTHDGPDRVQVTAVLTGFTPLSRFEAEFQKLISN